ncbi:hypothetical protein FN846DRAFT_1021962 [Sphaerosporella brunnea]|uniref:Mid2 domain-containing protein n=1 Tax=Sphaerosporella brunnea TaxID=1250544 RepID=A0A5J5EVI2_9PEZI|nr:hypothetical protein FN846DRAFT_1021962 [Sphaerosporella brunnea]
MRLPHVSSLSLLSLGLISHVAAKPVALPEAFALAEPQACPIACNKICCKTSQYCASFANSQCGEGQGINDTGNSGGGGGATQFFTSTLVITQTGVQTITSVFVGTTVIGGGVSSGLPSYPTLTGISSGFTSYPTYRDTDNDSLTPIMTVTTRGSNTFLVPVPTASDTTDFNSGGIIGGNSSPQGLTSAQIGGIVGGILGAFFLIALVLLCCCMRRGFNSFFGWMNSWGHGHETTVVHTGGGGGGHGGHHVAEAAAGAGLLGYLFGRRRGSHHAVAGGTEHQGSSGMKKTGMAALLGGAAAGLTSIFASRRKTQHSEKYSTTDISSGYYTSDITDSTSYTTSTSESSSSSSSSSSSESGHPHHGRR